MSKTLFLKDNKLFIRLKEGEFEVSNPELIGRTANVDPEFFVLKYPLKTKSNNGLLGIEDELEWPYGVEFVFQHRIGNGEWQSTNEYYFIHLASIPGSQRRKLAQLLPDEENTGAHSYTESAYKEGEKSGSDNQDTIYEAWTAWEEDQKNNPSPVNPHAFTFGYVAAKKKYAVSAPSESQPHIFYGYLEEGVYGEFRHVPEPSPNKDKIGFIFGGKRYEFSRLAEPNKNKPESQEEMWHSWEEGAELGKEVDVMLYDGSILKNCIPQTDGDFYYKPFDRFFDIAAVKQWKYSFENLYD